MFNAPAFPASPRRGGIMPVEQKKIRIARVVAAIFLAAFFAGCSTVKYKSESVSGPSKPAGYPIPLYTLDTKVPRPSKVLGIVSVHAGDFTMFGGSPEIELAKAMQKAHEKGADAVKITDWKMPDFRNPNYGLTAEILRYTDVWETVSKEKFQKYLAANRQNLDPIEGIWFSRGLDGMTPHTIGIFKDNSKPGRDFIGFILESENPAWTTGMKKMDIRRGLRPGSYILDYYTHDFFRRETSILLGQKRAFTFNLPKNEQDNFITYTKIND